MKFTKLIILGAGGVGFWLVVALMRMVNLGDVDVTVYDDDTLEGGNGFRRLPHTFDQAQYKVALLEEFLKMVMGSDIPHCVRERLTPTLIAKMDEDYFPWKETLIVDATDMADGPRKDVWDLARLCGATLMRVSYDGIGVIVVSPSIPFASKRGQTTGYALMPDQGQTFAAAGLGAMAVKKALLSGEITEMQVQIAYPQKEEDK